MSDLLIICGHGEGDPGACNGKVTEAERVRALAQRIKHFGGAAVEIGDTSKNWYKGDLITKAKFPKGTKILELHMNGFHLQSARGGHVIIKSGLTADKYDKALAEMITKMFPGRPKAIESRSDLANPKRAYNKGYNYRLLECGFITNSTDLSIFNSKMDELAKGILKCFDIATASETPAKTETKKMYRVQVGAFTSKANAEKLKKELKSKGYDAIIKED